MSFVPPPPPGVVVPAAPAAGTAAAPAVPPAKVVKPGGVALDMSDLFGPPKTGAKKALPPWERKKKTPPPGSPATATDDPLAPPPAKAKSPPHPGQPSSAATATTGGVANRLVFKSTAETSYPSLSSLPAPTVDAAGGPNAPAAVTRKSAPSATLTASPVRVAAVPMTSSISSPALPASTAAAANATVASAGSPHATSLPAVVPVHASTAAASPSASNPATGTVPAGVAGAPQLPPALPTATTVAPLPTYVASATSAVPPPAGATAVAPSQSQQQQQQQQQQQPPLPGSDPAAIATSARIVEEAMREVHMHFATPNQTVVAPHVLFQGRAQTVAVMPCGPVPPKKKKPGRPVGRTDPATTATATAVAAAVAAASSSVWHNQYDLRPSPTCNPTYLRGRTSSAGGVGAQTAKRDWRGAYFQNVDVHRYVARRYFGDAPPVEH